MDCLSFQKGNTSGVPLVYPLTEVPSDDGTSGLVSPRIGKIEYDIPTPPKDSKLREAMHEVVRVRLDVEAGRWPSWFFEKYNIDSEVPEPLVPHVCTASQRTLSIDGVAVKEMVYGNPDPKKAAELVHMDQPIDLGRILVKWLLSNGASWKCDEVELHDPFLDKQPEFYQVLGTNVAAALDAAFDMKWFDGAPRPEEYFGFNMTAYKEGSPAHPSGRIAGHGAASGASYATLVGYLNMSDDLMEVAKQACLHFSTYRTLAGVHIESENLNGFSLGVAVVDRLNS